MIAMELNTRWVHVIHKVRKGDIHGFIARLNARLINGIEWSGDDYSLFTKDEMGRSIEHYFEQHRELRFCQQTDRSVMTHIAQVCAEYQMVYRSVGAFPEDEETALEFDLRLNDTLRSKKGDTSYWTASERMLEHWLKAYMLFSDRKAQQRVNRLKRTHEESLLSVLSEAVAVLDHKDNVVHFADYRKK
ncbi:TPA: hypothetical protein QHU17_001540 [Enterobacter hormaechei subsp. xiangfangensis]|nr:hypothetical protein [Enterobacter hormaechei subsp. xiangfangensis]